MKKFRYSIDENVAPPMMFNRPLPNWPRVPSFSSEIESEKRKKERPLSASFLPSLGQFQISVFFSFSFLSKTLTMCYISRLCVCILSVAGKCVRDCEERLVGSHETIDFGKSDGQRLRTQKIGRCSEDSRLCQESELIKVHSIAKPLESSA